MIEFLISKEMKRNLMMEVTMEEVGRTVFSFGSLRAPSLDGFYGAFFQKNWNLV